MDPTWGIHGRARAPARPLRRALARAGGALADLLWPPRSLLTNDPVPQAGVIEARLWRELRFLSPPWCGRCGYPFETPEADGALCGACAADPPVYDKARAALAYDDHARTLALALKRAGRRDGLSLFASWMAEAGADLIAEADCLVPVPLHWTRLWARRFNQSAWLAQALGRRTGKPVLVAGLERAKARRSQAGLTADQRRRNVQGAFRATRGAQAKLAGRTILLIDDVFTTGATVEACTRALKRGGAARVHVLALARVVRPVDVSI